MDSAHRGWWHILFPGPAPNVLALLVAQGEVTEEGLRHCAAWSATGSPKESEEVTRCHIQAYEARRTVLAALQAADNQLGNRSRHERSSTDANIPLSMGIPAISLGAGGRSGGAHTLDEWYDPAGRELGLQRVALTVLSLAGLAQ